MGEMMQRWAAAILMAATSACVGQAQQAAAPRTTANAQACCKSQRHSAVSKRAAAKFAKRAEALLGTGPAGKGEWGLLIVDAESVETLYQQNADRYFVPASNMKLFATALALAKLGQEFRFHTTLETSGGISSGGLLTENLILVGRGDPNLSNRKFPYELKEEFDGPPEKVIAELADAIAAKGVKEISGDVIGDDSYFPRERYPNGWEIDDMVWEYGAAISAIVVDDNTVQLTLTAGEKARDRVESVVMPTTPEFTVGNQVVTSAVGVKAELTLKRELGSDV